MKKFVGYVNGKSFDNEKDFNDAANKAIEENDGSLSISSYYSYTKDDQDGVKQIEDVKNDKFVSTHEYFLGERKPDEVNANSVKYNIPENLKNKLENAINKDGIKKNLNYHISQLDNNITNNEDNIKKIQGDIEKLQNKLYDNLNTVNDLKGRKEYYDNLLNIVDNSQKVEKNQNEDEQATKPVTKDRIKEVFGIDADMSLYSFLKQLGLLK